MSAAKVAALVNVFIGSPQDWRFRIASPRLAAFDGPAKVAIGVRIGVRTASHGTEVLGNAAGAEIFP
jgi:hypothetical protein